MPSAWDIGYTQPFINCQGKSATNFFYFWSCKTPPRHIWKPRQYIPQQGRSLHIWTTSLSTTGCYKNKYIIKFFWVVCISRFATAILSGETELALGTIRVNQSPASKYPPQLPPALPKSLSRRTVTKTRTDGHTSPLQIMMHLLIRLERFAFFYGIMISFLLASLITIFLGVSLTCYSLLEPPLLGCLFFQDPLRRTELELPVGLSPNTQGTDNPALAGDKCSSYSKWSPMSRIQS